MLNLVQQQFHHSNKGGQYVARLSFTFNGRRKDYIFLLREFSRPAWSPIERDILTVPNYAGGYLLQTNTGVRQIDVPVVIKAGSQSELQKIKEDLANWLITDEPKELVFDDEKDRTYMAVISGPSAIDELMQRGRGTLTFICPMPYKLGDVRKHDFVEEFTGLSVMTDNRGSADAKPIIEVKVENPSTFLDIWHDEDYFRVGYPLEISSKPVAEKERVLWDDMSTVLGWTAVTGTVEDLHGTGSFKVQQGYGLYVEDYGQGTGFHGAIAKKNIPKGPLQDFEMEAWMRLKSAGTVEMGKTEVLLLDEASNIVARINMNDLFWDAEQTKAYMRIGNPNVPNSIRKLVDTTGEYATTFNQFYGRVRIARRGNKWSVYVARFRNGTEIDGATLVASWVDDKNTNPMTKTKIAQVMISIQAWGTNYPVKTMQIDDLKIWKVNNVSENQIPYIADKGDKIVIDTERNLVTVNGKSIINIKDVFSTYPVIPRGVNRLRILPSDIGTATLTYRERFR